MQSAALAQIGHVRAKEKLERELIGLAALEKSVEYSKVLGKINMASEAIAIVVQKLNSSARDFEEKPAFQCDTIRCLKEVLGELEGELLEHSRAKEALERELAGLGALDKSVEYAMVCSNIDKGVAALPKMKDQLDLAGQSPVKVLELRAAFEAGERQRLEHMEAREYLERGFVGFSSPDGFLEYSRACVAIYGGVRELPKMQEQLDIAIQASKEIVGLIAEFHRVAREFRGYVQAKQTFGNVLTELHSFDKAIEYVRVCMKMDTAVEELSTIKGQLDAAVQASAKIPKLQQELQPLLKGREQRVQTLQAIEKELAGPNGFDRSMFPVRILARWGRDSVFVKGEAESCINWATDKLRLAGIELRKSPIRALFTRTRFYTSYASYRDGPSEPGPVKGLY